MCLSELRGIMLILGLCLGLAACESAEDRAEAYFESAQDLIAAGDDDRAIIELRNVFKLVPTHVEARRSMARLMEARGNRPGAFRQYMQLVELLPDDAEGRTALAEFAFETRNWEEFVIHGTRAVELTPDSTSAKAIEIALAYRAAILERDGPAADAASLKAEEVAATLENGSSLLEEILFDSYTRAGRLEDALAQLDRMIARRPEVRSNYDQRLLLLRETASPTEIEAHLRRVVETFTDDIEAKRMLVQYLVAAQDLDKAEAFLREIGDPAEQDPTYFISLIQFLKELRSNEAARMELDAGIALSPEPDRLRMIRAALDFEDGQPEMAIADLQAVLDRRDSGEDDTALTNEIRITLSRMLQSMDNTVGAQQLVDKVLSLDADNVAALKNRAARQIDADETDAAIADLRRALDTAPEDLEALELMANAYLRAGSRDLARDYVAQAVGASGNAPGPSLRYAQLLRDENNTPAAEEVLIAALRRTPNNEEILLLLGEIYLETEDFTRAEMVAGNLRRLGTDPAKTAADGIEIGLLALRKGNAEALAFLEEIAKSSEAGFAEKVVLLRAQLTAGQPDEALQLAEALAAEAPDDPDRRFLLAMTQAATGELTAARAGLRALVTEEPNREAVWQQLYRIAATDAGPEVASAVLTEALEAIPASAVLQWARAAELEQKGEIDAAIVIYEGLYARDSSSVIVANNLASLLVTYRDDAASLDRAWAIARRLRDTEVPAFQDTYGWLAFRRGEPETALPYLEAAATGLPQDPIVQYHLAEAYAALDRPEDAIAAYTRVLDVASEDDPRPQIARARDALTRLQQTNPEAGKP